ncbi:hypothetical protein [Collinsella sp. CM84Y_54]|uniref:hypothetical protein n=1 Tax=Collinsella sp. CM84Y_54 TaxID=3085309 RepID=UPI002E7A8CA9|nr:hypothetical protein [Collinsella sp. CM84Y_54]
MAINKVVYGTTVLVDLTSDTVDAAHLAKGRTAHDAGGNLIVGTLEQQGSDNLLSGVTPSLLNGATQSGKAYVIPAGGAYGTDYIEYRLDIPTQKPDAVYCLLAYGKSQSGYRSLSAELHSDGGVSSGSSSLLFTATPSVKAVSFDLTSGAKPTKLVIKAASSSGEQVDISKVMLMALDV